MKIAVKTALPSNKAMLRELQAAPKKLTKVYQRAINKTAKSVRTHISSVLRNELNIKKTDLDNRNLKVFFSRAGDGTKSLLTIRGARIPLIYFDAKQGPRSQRNPHAPPGKKGVTYRIKKGGKREDIRNAFIVTFRSGHTAVVRRAGKKRYKIHQLFGPSVKEAALNNPKLSKAALAPVIENRLQKEVDHAAKRVLKLK